MLSLSLANSIRPRRISALNPIPALSPMMWMDASTMEGYEDEDVVDTFPDSSGNANDATQATFIQMPIYSTGGIGGKPALQFDGIDDFLEGMDLSEFTAGTLFLVARKNVQADSCGLCYSSTSGSGFLQTFTANDLIYEGWGSTVRYGEITPPVSLTSPFIYNIRTAANAWSLRLNGSEAYSTATNTVGFSSHFSIGTGDPTSPPSANWLAGYIAEIIVFNSALSANDNAAVNAWLARKYSVTLLS